MEVEGFKKGKRDDDDGDNDGVIDIDRLTDGKIRGTPRILDGQVGLLARVPDGDDGEMRRVGLSARRDPFDADADSKEIARSRSVILIAHVIWLWLC